MKEKTKHTVVPEKTGNQKVPEKRVFCIDPYKYPPKKDNAIS